MDSQFVILHSYPQSSAKVVCLKDHVSASCLGRLLITYGRLLDWDNRSSLASQRDPIKHMVQRKPWNRAFSSAAVKEYEGIAAKRTRQLLGCLEDVVHQWDGNKGAVLDMASWFNYFT